MATDVRDVIPFAFPGEQVTSKDGKPICKVKNQLFRFGHISADDFHEFEEGEAPWASGDPFDARCIRAMPIGTGKVQICINGEWRP